MADTDEGGRKRSGRWRTGAESRQRILNAARSLFAERGYDRTTTRAIAAQAGADPAMVHYFFGTKSQLFATAMQMPVNPAEHLASVLAAGLDGAGERIVSHFLRAWDELGSVEPLFALLRSAPTDEDSASMFKEFVQREIVGRLERAVGGPDAHLRAELAGSQLMGIALARYVVRIEPLASTPAETLAARVGPTLQHYLTGPDPSVQ
ncbi:MAG: TetR family transcriptional regulator [Streptosporangiales bacterium]